jgi:hypothetical protein
MIQQYFCPICRHAGEIEIRKDAGVNEVINVLESDHAAKSPECRAGIRTLRVRNPELCTPEQWAELISSPEVRG